MDHTQTTPDREQRLDEAIANYLRELSSGQSPDRQEWLARHPDLADDLADFFRAQEEMDRLARPLRQVVRAAGTLSRSAEDTPASFTDLPPNAPFRCLGDHELLEEIGQGGMGVVYRARQKSLNRLVAVKRLRGERPAEEVQRFRNEALTVAELDHAHIVPVYDVGEHDGQLYFSMKLFEGGSLAEHLDRYVADPRAAARLLAEVARAVHHAHQRGVLHRDLKPSNILLNAAGRPHVTDFGLAKRTADESSLTLSGQLVGTPSYMAPEQAGGKKQALTTATDIYGLGAILYALLVGRPPFRADSVLDTLQQVKEQEPKRPHSLNRRVPRDLETICLKCLRKEPVQRYGSAEALADDLERYLRGDPIQARPIGPLARMRHWCRRNPLGVVLALTAGVALFGPAVGVVLLWQEQNQTAAALRQVEIERDAKAEQQRQARRAVDDMYTAVAEEWLAYQPRLQTLQHEFLEKALTYYQQAAADDQNDPNLKAQAARAQTRVGNIQLALGRPEQARLALDRAVALLQSLVTNSPTTDDHARQLAYCHSLLGNALMKIGALGEAEAAYKQALDLFRQRIPATPSWSAKKQGALAALKTNLAMVLAKRGKSGEAENQYRSALSTLVKVVAQYPTDRSCRIILGGTHANLGNLYMEGGRYKDAVRSYEGAVQVFQSLARDNPTLPECLDGWGYNLANLSGSLSRSGRNGEAIQRGKEAVAILERLVRDYPDVADYAWELGSALGNLGTCLGNDGQGQEAVVALGRANDLLQKVSKEHPRMLEYRHAQALNERHRGDVLRRQLKRPAEAEAAYKQAIGMYQEIMPRFPGNAKVQIELALAYGNLGVLYHQGGRLSAATAALREALRIHEQLVAADPHNAFYQDTLRETRGILTAVLVAADPPFPEAAWVVRVLEEELKQDPQRGNLWYRLGVARYRMDNAKGAVQALRKARELKFEYGREGTLYAAMAVWRRGDREDARRIYDAVVKAQASSNKSPTERERRLQAEAARLLGVSHDREGMH